MDYKKVPKSSNKYYCEKCDYVTSRLSQWKRHLQTKKHNAYNAEPNVYICLCEKIFNHRQSLYRHKKTCKIFNKQEQNDEWQKNGKKWQKNGKIKKCPFLCVCGKGYKQQCSLSKHKKICQVLLSKNESENNTETEDLKEMVKELIKFAKEPKIINNTNNNNTQFNVMNYLNTECKDAMNLSDFINQFTFSLEDLEILGTQGYQKAMEKTFVKQLRDMDKTKRPIHCSDQKRKSFYVKENDVWEKDVDNKKLLTSIKSLSRKQFKTIKTWIHRNHDWLDNDLKHDFFNKSVVEVGKCDTTKETSKVLCGLSSLSLR